MGLGINELRKLFIDFFTEKDHIPLDSFSLVPVDDDSILLINAGMAPLKPYFTGEKRMAKDRAASSQKCVRTQDIDSVGKTDRHATFFEMLGNFSFGDYFKKEAIAWAYEFLTERVGLDKERMWISVYEDDDEAYDLWVNTMHIPEERMLRLGKEDNFWELDQGPCGPCSEIHYDRGEEFGEGNNPTENSDRYMEVWNLVFTQFDKKPDGSYEPLAKPNIDTGMGLERLALVTENKRNIFELEEAQPMLSTIGALSGKVYGNSAKDDESFRVITDHSHAMTFLVMDGVVPSNEGRGYVLRRLIRRALRHGKRLGIEGEFLTKTVEQAILRYQSAYPELTDARERIMHVIVREEEQFFKTIDQGLALLEGILLDLKAKNQTILEGESAFKLYDTYGFPYDLTLEIAKESGISVDEDAFSQLMEKQREMSRTKAQVGAGWSERREMDLSGLVATDFSGYDKFEDKSQVSALYFDDERRDAIACGQEGIAVFANTPFYARGGGQVADIGTFSSANAKGMITDTSKDKDGIFYHTIKVDEGTLAVGDDVSLSIAKERRMDTMRNHSATHLLHKALKMVLGEHVKQAGSYVDNERLRFDFSHYEKMTDAELAETERLVNEAIFDSLPVEKVWKSLEEANREGVVGLFEDKYGQTVRVVSMGDFSRELCGGTHVDNTSQILMFRIQSEQAISSGVRRIEGITGPSCYRTWLDDEKNIEDISELVKTQPDKLKKRVEQLVDENRELQSQLASFRSKAADELAGKVREDCTMVGDVRLLAREVENRGMDELKELCDHLKEGLEDYVIVLGSSFEGKVYWVVSVDDTLTKQGIHAGKLVKELAKVTGGNGGGRPNFATAGGKDGEKIPQALGMLEEWISHQKQ